MSRICPGCKGAEGTNVGAGCHTCMEYVMGDLGRRLYLLQNAIPTPGRLREMADAIWKLCEDCDDSAGPNGCDVHRKMAEELRTLAGALEGKRATEP